jgi:protein FrlC
VYINYTFQYAIRDLHQLGYDGIEVYGGRPHMYRDDLDEELDGILALLEQFGMRVSNYIPAQFRYPAILCSENEKVRRDTVEYLKTGIDNAVKIGAPTVDIIPGFGPFDRSLKTAWNQLKKTYRELLEYAQDKPVKFVIEHGHRYESNLICTIEECLRMIDELKSDRVGVLVDTGHVHLNRERFGDIIPRCKGLPLHIHVDDNDGAFDSHLIPGLGTIPFDELAEALDRIGYDGFLSGELGPKYIIEPTEPCRQTLEYMRRTFNRKQ